MTRHPADGHTAPPTPVDVDVAVLLETASRHGVRVWRADPRGELQPIPNPTKENT